MEKQFDLKNDNFSNKNIKFCLCKQSMVKQINLWKEEVDNFKVINKNLENENIRLSKIVENTKQIEDNLEMNKIIANLINNSDIASIVETFDSKKKDDIEEIKIGFDNILKTMAEDKKEIENNFSELENDYLKKKRKMEENKEDEIEKVMKIRKEWLDKCKKESNDYDSREKATLESLEKTFIENQKILDEEIEREKKADVIKVGKKSFL